MVTELHAATIANGPDTRTEVSQLPDGRVELRHAQWADGLGWYVTQRLVLEPEALPALCEALSVAQRSSGSMVGGPSPKACRPSGKVVALDAWRRARG